MENVYFSFFVILPIFLIVFVLTAAGFVALIIYNHKKLPQRIKSINSADVKLELDKHYQSFLKIEKFDLVNIKQVQGDFNYFTGGGLEVYDTKIALPNQHGEKALVAYGKFKNFKPFKVMLLARFDRDILKVELTDYEFIVYLNDKSIAKWEFATLLHASSKWGTIQNMSGETILWYDRPYMYVTGTQGKKIDGKWYGGLNYSFFNDDKKENKLADIHRVWGRENKPIISEDDNYILINYLAELDVEKKAIILGYFLFDMMFNI